MEEVVHSTKSLRKLNEKQFENLAEACGKLHKAILANNEEIKQHKKMIKATVKPVSDPSMFPQLPLKTVESDFEKT
jgi:hypothetical protein